MHHPPSKLEFLQALRGLAALAVVLWHGSRFISPYYEGLGYQLFGAGGSMGVDLFFVVSGFIMTYTTRDGADAYDFAVKRFSRVWPVYAIYTFAYVLLLKGAIFWSDPANVSDLFASLLFFPVSTGIGGAIWLPVLGVGWTLNYEIYFYAIFGLSLLFGRYRWAAFFGWVSFSLIAFPALFGSSSITLSPAVNYGFSFPYLALATNPMVWMFVSGVIIGLIYNTRIRVGRFTSLILVLSSSALFMFQYAAHFNAGHGILHGGSAAVMLVFCLSIASKSITIPVPIALVVLGDVSYSLYLCHPLVQEGIELIFKSAGYSAYATGFSFLFLTTAISIVLAMVSHRLLEIGLGAKTRDLLLSIKTGTHGKG